MDLMKAVRAFMKPEDAANLENAIKIGGQYMIETRRLLEENNNMLKRICEKEGITNEKV